MLNDNEKEIPIHKVIEENLSKLDENSEDFKKGHDTSDLLSIINQNREELKKEDKK